MDLGDDLSLDLLEEGSDTMLFGDLDVKAPEGQTEVKKEPEIKQSGEGPVKKDSESVAGEEEKTVIPEKKASDSISSPKGGESEDLSQVYSSLATHLHKSGVLSSLNEDTPIKSFNDLQKAIKNEITNGIDTISKSYQEAMERGVSEDEFVQYERAMGQLNAITPDVIKDENSSELRFKILAQDFLNRNFTREEAEKYAKRSVDLGEDITDAEKALGNIKQHTQSQFDKRQGEIEEEEKQVNNDIKQFIDKTSEVIDGIKLDDNQKERLFKQITTPIGRDKETGNVISKYGKALREDPVKMKVMTEYLFMITDGFSDFSKLNTEIETEKTKELDNILKQSISSFSQDGSATSGTDKESSFLIGDLDIDV